MLTLAFLCTTSSGIAAEGLTQRLVTVQTRDGQELIGRLALPADAEGPVPVIFHGEYNAAVPVEGALAAALAFEWSTALSSPPGWSRPTTGWSAGWSQSQSPLRRPAKPSSHRERLPLL